MASIPLFKIHKSQCMYSVCILLFICLFFRSSVLPGVLVAYGCQFETKRCQIFPKNAASYLNGNHSFGDQFTSWVTLSWYITTQMAEMELKITERSKHVEENKLHFHDQRKKWKKKRKINFFRQLTLRDHMKF